MGERLVCRIVIITGFMMMGAGIINGEMGTVLEKAVNICLECIGIG